MPVVGPIPHHTRAHRIGGWLPHDRHVLRRYVNDVVKRAEDASTDFIEPVQGLADLINTSPVVYMLFTEMLTEVPVIPPYDKDPSLQPEIRDVGRLLTTINYIVTHAVPYNDSVQIGTPINAILDWPMGTKSGFAAFLRDDVNGWIQKILEHWGAFLNSTQSLKTVDTSDGNWLSSQAQHDANNPGLANFLETYEVPNPTDSHYGFASWDAFFTRHFKPDKRPLPRDLKSKTIVSAAESTPFYIQENVRLQDRFWAKDQHYALDYLLGDANMAKEFEGGTVYQAFLSADSYHNWHAPVSGTYLKAPRILPGTYYSEPLLWGFSPDPSDKTVPQPDAASDARSQGYIACLAKRGVVFIQPDDHSLGIIAVVMIGMAEVSSIDFDKIPATHGFPLGHFNMGDEIGRFHFGGSTHCLVFQKHVKFTPVDTARILDPTHYYLNQSVIKVRSELGTLTPK